MRVGHEAGEQPGGGAAVAEEPRLLLREGRRRHVDLAGAAVGPLERRRGVRPAAGLAGGEPGRLPREEPAHHGPHWLVLLGRGVKGHLASAAAPAPAARDGVGQRGEERARRGAVPRQLRRRHAPVVRRRRAVHGQRQTVGRHGSRRGAEELPS